MVTTFADHADRSASEKIGLAVIEAGQRLVGWQNYAAATYFLENFQLPVISELKESGTAWTAAATLLDCQLTAGTYYLDRDARRLYAHSTLGENPNGLFVGLIFPMFFSTHGVNLPWDLGSGFEVEWLPLLKDTSEFGVELDNSNQLGIAIEGSGSIKFFNDFEFWKSRFDKLVFENQKCEIYSWARDLPPSQRKILFRGRIQSKTYDPSSVSFALKDSLNALRAPIPMSDMQDVVGARLPDSLKSAKQRLVYGYTFGHRPTPIDAVLQGYPLVGTVDVTNGSTAVVGTGTEFLRQISPDDEILVGSTSGRTYAVASVTDDTNLVLNEAYEGGSLEGADLFIKPNLPKRYANRVFLIAGHALREPVTDIATALPNQLNRIIVTDPTDLLIGDEIVVGSEQTSIERIFGSEIKLTSNLLAAPLVGTTVTRPAVTGVFLNDRELVLDRDYTYDPLTAILTLDQLAEFNVAPVVSIAGSVTFNGTRTVTGSGTQFKTQVKPGDWIKKSGQFDYFEVLSVIDDTNLELRTAATYSGTAAALAKRPKYYDDSVVLSCDVLGKTLDGTTSGTLLKTGPAIVRDLLQMSSVSELLELSSFADSDALTTQRLSVVIPKGYADRNVPKLKDVINEVNKSVFGSLIQNSDFLLAYHVFRPVREQSLQVFAESDILKFAVKSVSDKIAKSVRLRSLHREFDPISRTNTFSETVALNKTATYLAKTENELLVDTLLVDPTDALIASSRWAFLIGVASTVVSFQTKLQGAGLNVNDRIEISHEKLYDRVGSNQTKKIAAVQSAKKSVFGVSIEIEDLSSAFSRCAAIVADGSPNFGDSSDSEKFYGSFITDTYGMQGNDPDTFGVNLIW